MEEVEDIQDFNKIKFLKVDEDGYVLNVKMPKIENKLCPYIFGVFSKLRESTDGQSEIEKIINDRTTREELILSGIEVRITDRNKAQFARPDLKIVDEIIKSGKLAKDITLDLSSHESDYVIVNGIITGIKIDDLRDLYNGLFELKGYKEAISTVVKILIYKLKSVFTVHDES